MQIEQSLRELLWNPEMVAGLPKLVLSLGIAALLGVVLGQVYIRFGHSLSNRRLFARNFLVLVVTTTLIISIVRWTPSVGPRNREFKLGYTESLRSMLFSSVPFYSIQFEKRK